MTFADFQRKYAPVLHFNTTAWRDAAALARATSFLAKAKGRAYPDMSGAEVGSVMLALAMFTGQNSGLEPFIKKPLIVRDADKTPWPPSMNFADVIGLYIEDPAIHDHYPIERVIIDATKMTAEIEMKNGDKFVFRMSDEEIKLFDTVEQGHRKPFSSNAVIFAAGFILDVALTFGRDNGTITIAMPDGQ